MTKGRNATVAEKVFVSLPVRDVPRSREFFAALGFGIEPRFSGPTAVCVVLGEDTYAMLASEAYFATFVPGRKVADAERSAEVVVAVGVGSREEVDALIDKAASAGGSGYREPTDLGGMYMRAFRDPDGHVWEALHMEEPRATDGDPEAA